MDNSCSIHLFTLQIQIFQLVALHRCHMKLDIPGDKSLRIHVVGLGMSSKNFLGSSITFDNNVGKMLQRLDLSPSVYTSK